MPILGRGGRSKIAKVGMAVGSMFAATVCALAVLGIDDLDMPERQLTVDQMFNEMQLRGLQAINEEENIIEEEESIKIPRRITQRLQWNANSSQKILPADDSQIINFYESGNKSYPCDNYKAMEFLDKIRMLEDYREDYLDKSIKAHCANQMFADNS